MAVRECFFCARPRPAEEFVGGNICRQCRDRIRESEERVERGEPADWVGPHLRRGDSQHTGRYGTR